MAHPGLLAAFEALAAAFAPPANPAAVAAFEAELARRATTRTA